MLLQGFGGVAKRVRIWETDESFAEASIDEHDKLVVSSYDAAEANDSSVSQIRTRLATPPNPCNSIGQTSSSRYLAMFSAVGLYGITNSRHGLTIFKAVIAFSS